MTAFAYRSHSVNYAGGVPGSITVSKPPGTVDADLITIFAAINYFGNPPPPTLDLQAGFTFLPRTRQGFTEGQVQYRLGGASPASWTLTPSNVDVVDILVVSVAWDAGVLGGTIDTSLYADGGAQTDSSAPLNAGAAGAANSVAQKWGITFLAYTINDAGGSTLTFGRPERTQDFVEVADSSADVGSNYRTYIRVYEEFRDDAWPSEATMMTWSGGGATVVNSVWDLWLPGYTALPTKPTGGVSPLPFDGRMVKKDLPYQINRAVLG